MKLLTLIVTFISFTALSACNTVQGAGQDLERAGEEIEEVGES
jgi:predicted small secreted protein